ncbi:hypothetical protein BDF19DRAFT_424057 [Syncephalis fuscata]|nr:hypothetical protein BDF19DRAFT_424057 [Syncephalis fuscata]
MLSLARVSATRATSMRATAVCAVARRMYTDEGAIRGANDSFSKKEKAVEDQYFRMQDAEKLKHLKEELEKLKKDISEIKQTTKKPQGQQ